MRVTHTISALQEKHQTIQEDKMKYNLIKNQIKMKNLLTLFLIAISVLTLNAQEADPTLITIEGKDVKLSEFEAIYKKNNSKEEITKESLTEYLDLYVKFKLKVREAEELGYDTTAAFINELAGYRKQLAQPYLTDREVTESLIKEAYERMGEDVKASHILINLSPEASAKDTLLAYNKAMKARRRILKGESFEKVAKEVSEDPSAKTNSGDLGYFSAFHMVYPFESASYETKVGELSMPVRTSFGYHLIKVMDKRNSRGTIKVAHIMVKEDRNLKTKGENPADKKKKIDEIYNKLINEKADFSMLAKQYSDDKGSAIKGGVLPEFNAGKMVEEFEDASFSLQNDGDISLPFQTTYGWHIVKRMSLKKMSPYDEMYNTLKSRVARDSRSNKTKEIVVARIKKENNFKEKLNERSDFYKIVDAKDFFNGTWTADKAKNLNKVMFGFYAADGDKMEYTQQDFANRLAKNSVKKSQTGSTKSIINSLYSKVVEKKALEFKDSRLSKTNQEFKLLMQEYRDGILLFNLTDEKVWSKAIKDSLGLDNFYQTNKSNYMWGERVKANLYTCSDEVVAKKVKKLLKKKAKKGYTNDDMLKVVNTDSQLSLKIEEGMFSKKDNENIAKATWEKGVISSIKNDNNIVLVEVVDVLSPQPKLLKEVKGMVTSDYQNYLEQEWIDELNSKYEVTVNKQVLKLVK